MAKDHNTITCTHSKGLACPVCYDQTHSLENSEFVVDPFDTYEQHELPPDATKSSCIALRASELNLPHVDVSGSELPRVERFGDLPDGALFYMAQGYAYGGRQKYQKVLEDGGEHNAVYANDTNLAMTVPDMQLVFRA